MITPATSAPPALKKTALNATHRALKAKMVDFGGWDMPVEYPGNGGGLIAEHMAVRAGVGLFDVSHMGEIQFRGPGALAAVQHITMNDASKLKDGQAHYSALLTSSGAFVDDILVHRLGENDYLLVVNAGTTEKDYAWIRKHAGGFPSVHISDYSPHYSQIAVQGPRALETLKKLTKVDLAAIKNYWFTWGTVAGIPNVLIARTGYSGEDGFEVYIPSDETTTVKMWDALMEAGSEFAIRACGLGARNTLRLEAGMSLYGHEISEEINALEGGLDRWLKLDKGDFIGRQALLAVQSSGGPKRKVIGLEMIDRGIARDGYPVLDLEGIEIGVVTSGSPAPFLKTNIALALVPAEVAASGSDLFVQVRANQVRAKQVPTPFYKRPKK
ncbi:glycine cleavage system aminomethyltransferase GcvT [Terracidiphilus sp.]|jgi:aminomethyltransferase|uniref:glycine cleavage system aminomethyltransferase GcvT n=1 Tax=Terracidiphilus sp. TaxID=1964191 RepID=UPI003C2488CE